MDYGELMESSIDGVLMMTDTFTEEETLFAAAMQDNDTRLIYSDYLEENQRDEEARAWRCLFKNVAFPIIDVYKDKKWYYWRHPGPGMTNFENVRVSDSWWKGIRTRYGEGFLKVAKARSEAEAYQQALVAWCDLTEEQKWKCEAWKP